MITYPFEASALRVSQPIGTFYVAVLPAELLLEVSTSDLMSATRDPSGAGYILTGTQRLVQDRRLTQIADYIDRMDASFPNSIILAANYNNELGLDQDETEALLEEEQQDADLTANERLTLPSKAWTIRQAEDGCFRLHIPDRDKLAAIIDGQHRLYAFAKTDPKRLHMQLICSIFLDLPKPIQAQLFATINSTQTPVNRSLTYELFGYNLADEPENLWTPAKLAVFLTRKLATEEGSVLQGRIVVAPKRDDELLRMAEQTDWKVSTSVVVDGILRLFSSNPKRDANEMRTPDARPREVLRNGSRDQSPLREIYIQQNDSLIYRMVDNYTRACNELFWRQAAMGSYIVKTVGVQALFDILRKLATTAIAAKNIRQAYFEEKLTPAADLDFSDERFRVPAGAGRSLIRKTIEEVARI